ncbi:MAG: hypothetical protein BVN28_08455 [Nitrospira sp. ST-bin4]|nr:MAG: hypothetical protein BVN28_08455 [Nitrospira sp. ST-bin4]
MGFKRKGWRAQVNCTGRLERGTLSVPCKVVDVSEDGVRLDSRMLVKTGDTVQLVIEVAPEKVVTCQLQVVYVRSQRLGGRIVSISQKDKERLTQFLDDRVLSNFSRR